MAGPVFNKAGGVANGFLSEKYLENENMDEESRLYTIDHPDDSLLYGAQKRALLGLDGATPMLTVDYRSQGKSVSVDAMEAMKARLNEWKAKRKKSSEDYQLYVKEMAEKPYQPGVAKSLAVDQKTVLGTPLPAGSTVLG